jgi:alkylhydroperoxidase family enzyme
VTSWIPDAAAGDTEFTRVFGLRENLFMRFGDFYARLWDDDVMDPVVVELCRLRVSQLIGCPSELAVRSRPAVDRGLTEETVAQLRSWPTAAPFDDTSRTCLGFAEQFVIDPTGITSADRARVRAAVGFPRLVGLTQAVAAFDGFDRFRLILGIDPPAEGAEGEGAEAALPVVVSVGVPDPSAPPVADSGDLDPDDPARGFSAAQPGLFASFERLYAVLWSDGVVDHPSKEVARLRNARVTGCRFCRNVRFERARRDGLTEDVVDLVVDGYESSALSDAHKAVIALTDAFLGDPRHGLDDGTRKALLAHYGSAGTVELAAGLALFMGFSKIAVALGAFPDDFPAVVIPTPGQAPAGR